MVSSQQVLLAMIVLICEIILINHALVLIKMTGMKMIAFAKQNDSHLAEVKRNPRVCLCKAKSKVGSFRWTVLDWQYWVGGPSLVERRGHFFDK